MGKCQKSCCSPSVVCLSKKQKQKRERTHTDDRRKKKQDEKRVSRIWGLLTRGAPLFHRRRRPSCAFARLLSFSSSTRTTHARSCWHTHACARFGASASCKTPPREVGENLKRKRPFVKGERNNNALCTRTSFEERRR